MPGTDGNGAAPPLTAETIIKVLELKRHPEGGWYREVFRAPDGPSGPGAITSIYFLLTRGDRSHWHRVLESDEVWNYHGGAPLLLKQAKQGGPVTELVLGLDITGGQHPQWTIPAGQWQAAESLGDWTLVGCSVGPAFQFSNFELAPPGWRPDRTQ